MSLRKRISSILLLLGGVPLALFGGFSYQQASHALKEKEVEQMIALRDLKVREIEAYFQQMEGQARTLSRSPLVVDGLQRLTPAFHALNHGYEHASLGKERVNSDSAESVQRALQEELELDMMLYLKRFYTDLQIPLLQQAKTAPLDPDALIPASHAAHRAQSLYLVGNPFEGTDREWLDDAGDGSRYSEIHREIHPILRSYRQEFGYYDLFLADLEGNLLYSVVKEIDFGSNLASGPYRESVIGKAWRAAMEEEDVDAVVMTDLEEYLPSLYQPAGVFASPVESRDGERVGVLLFQFPLDRINTMVQDRQGMEESSEVVLGMEVGGALIYLNELLFSEAPSMQKKVAMGEAYALPMQAALRSMVGSGNSIDYQGNEVLAAWAPVTRLNWGVVAKINREQALMDATELLHRTLLSLGGLILIILLVAWRGAASIVNPIVDLVRCFRQVQAGDFSVRAPIHRDDELGLLAGAFNQMSAGLHQTTTSLDHLNEILASMDEGVLVLGPNGLIEHANSAFCELSGYPLKQVLSSPIETFFSEVSDQPFRDRELLMKTAEGAPSRFCYHAHYSLHTVRTGVGRYWSVVI